MILGHGADSYALVAQAESPINQLEKKHRIIADNLIDAIWSLDVATLKFDYITPSIERISGFTADEYINFTLQESLTPESFQKVTAMLAEEIPRFEQGVNSILLFVVLQ